MKGHEPLIEMRKRGMNPPMVFIDLEPDRLKCWRDWHAIEGAKPTINVGSDETIARLDLRCVHGLLVSVHGNDEGRVISMLEACRGAGATKVFGSVCGEKNRLGEPEITAMADEGGIVWRKS